MQLHTYLGRFPFPLAPAECLARLKGPKVLVNSCPKAGTHLLAGAIANFPLIVPRWRRDIADIRTTSAEIAALRRGQVLTAHLFWTEELLKALVTFDVQSVFIIRDLRDVVVSRAFYHARLENHPAYPDFQAAGTFQDQLLLSINGLPDTRKGFLSIRDWAIGYAPWLTESKCLCVRFEELIGLQGGGSDITQRKTIQAIAEYLGFDFSSQQIEEIASRTFNPKSNTFRKGCIGDWKLHFNSVHKRAFKELAGDFLIQWGYAKDNDW